MNPLESSFYAIAITVFMLCLFVVNANNAPGKRLTVFAVYICLESVGFALEWLLLHPAIPLKALWLGLLMAVSLMIPPCLWLFAREITEHKTPPLAAQPRWHFLVIGAGMLLTLPLIQTSHWGFQYADPNSVTSHGHQLFIHGAMLACASIFLIQVAYYLRLCIGILRTHTRQSKALFSDISDRNLDTLRLLIFIVWAGAAVKLLRTLHCLIWGSDFGWGIVFTALEVTVAVTMVAKIIRRSSHPIAAPAGFSAQPTVIAPDDTNLPVQQVQKDIADSKYERSALDARTRQRILSKLEAAMATGRMYLDSQLTLTKLCAELNESTHYVSQVINQDLETTFYDLVNRYRVENAQAMLLSDTGKTVLEIALESGFNSKSTFNAAFRLHAGTTPSAYRKQDRAVSA